jgi:hypothetical protein
MSQNCFETMKQASNFSDQSQQKHDSFKLFKIQPVYEYLLNLIHTVVVVVMMMIQRKHPQLQLSGDQQCFFLYYYYKYLLQIYDLCTIQNENSQ